MLDSARWILCILLSLSTGCAHYIEGTKIRETADTRAIAKLLEDVRVAFESSDLESLLKRVSPRYFEDMGTPNPDDDFGFEQLRTEILPSALRAAQETRLAFKLHDVQVVGKNAHADIRYSSRSRLSFPAGKKWEEHRDFQRITLAKEDGQWRITGGL